MLHARCRALDQQIAYLLLQYAVGIGHSLVLAQVLVAPTVPATPAWIAETSARIDEEYLQPIAARVRQRGYDVGTHVAMAGDAARGALDIVNAERAYLRGLSPHGRTGPRRRLLGRLADKLLRASEVPMLVTPMT